MLSVNIYAQSVDLSIDDFIEFECYIFIATL